MHGVRWREWGWLERQSLSCRDNVGDGNRRRLFHLRHCLYWSAAGVQRLRRCEFRHQFRDSNRQRRQEWRRGCARLVECLVAWNAAVPAEVQAGFRSLRAKRLRGSEAPATGGCGPFRAPGAEPVPGFTTVSAIETIVQYQTAIPSGVILRELRVLPPGTSP